MNRRPKIILSILAIILSVALITGTIIHAKNNLKTETNTTNQQMQQPPAKPEGDTTTDTQTPPTKPEGDTMGIPTQTKQLTIVYVAIIAASTLLLFSSITLLAMSKLYTQSVFVNGDKIMIYILLNVLLTAGTTYGLAYLTNNYILNTSTTQTNTQENTTQNTSVGESAHTLTNNETTSNTTFTSTTADEYALLADGVTATLDNIIVNKSGDSSSTESSSFYGLNSAVFATNGGALTITNSKINTSGEGANGVFAYGTGEITISNSTITADSAGAGGIQVAGGGTIKATNLTVTSTGKAAIRSDKGGGTMTVDGGTYTTTADNGAPAVYSTAKITVSNATLTAQKSQAVIIEGKNSVILNNCTVSGNDTESTGNIFLYQSMSGDAEEGTSVFTMNNGSITANQNVMFGITNTNSVININNVTLNYASGKTLISMFEGRWGTAGSNGGTLEFNATNQTLTGDVKVGNSSTLKLSLVKSTLTGAIENEGKTTLILDSNSIWNVTGESHITTLTDSDTTYSNIKSNGYNIYYDKDSNTSLNGKTIELADGGKLIAE